MNSEELIGRKKELDKLISKLEKEIKRLPKGNLIASKHRDGVQFYIASESVIGERRYLKNKERKLAEQLAQKNYYEKLIKECTRESKTIEQYLNGMKGIRPEDVYDSISEYKKAIVKPVILSDAQYAKLWEAEEYEPNPYKREECKFDTDKGDKVRSRVEALIANMYFSMGVPYRYEAPLQLKNGKIKYPDFTLLKLPERTEIYHEHLGMMEDENYRRPNIIKISEYMASGIVTGKNLFLTFDTEYAPPNLKDIKASAKEILGI